MLPPARSPGMGTPVSPSMGGSARDNYTTSTPHLHHQRHNPHTLSPRHPDLSRYSGSLPDTPRSVLQPTTMSMANSAGYGTASLMNYSQPDRQGDSPPFNAQDTFYEINCEGQVVTPHIDAKIDKGFFVSSDAVWTCYRRNYFAVTVSFTLNPHIANGRLYLNHAGKPEQIQAFAVQLSAAVDGTGGKSIELIQHTPKRDKGPQMTLKKELLAPTPPGKSHTDHSYSVNSFHTAPTLAGPNLPLQNDGDQNHQYSPASHSSNGHQRSFDRIQFKSATANNGKRRAQQQFYHLIVELYANIQSPRDKEPNWVKIAARSSSPVVVRGRSPSHYQNEGPHNSGASRGGSGAGGGGLGHPQLGSNGGPAFNRGFGNGLSGGRSGTMGGGMYRGTTYSLDPSPVGSHSVSSASSLSGGPVEGLVGDQHMVDEDEGKAINGYDGYQYYPGTIYENMPGKADAQSGLPLPERRVKDEFPGPAAIASGWQIGGCGRFQGMETSRGYYPDLHTHIAHTGY
ncbi:p53-like transcription factor [Delitschia confertaspora ATCC 74209]|uniref:P53-like transcription factor n=1 Tax=Delitschia confertaspora ATCC 74209 TaxID=1513339 RepID=A0A9P4MUM9_9PLEO|nr:p53-like transcription factor [Delitschia confertaspora ATCC 74209]